MPEGGGAGECQGIACQRVHECSNSRTDCGPGFECVEGADGYRVCRPVASGALHSACTGRPNSAIGTCNAGLLCCAGGSAAPSGVAGRCAECCQTGGIDGCTGGAVCCDNVCLNPNSNRNCGGCAVEGIGEDCTALTSNVCYPLRCDEGSCVSRYACGDPEVNGCATDFIVSFADPQDFNNDGTIDIFEFSTITDQAEVASCFPLNPPSQRCGSCDSDSDCATGLFCFSPCSEGAGFNIFCFDSKYCVEEIGDCQN